MRTDTSPFEAKNKAPNKRPRYVIEIAFDSANTILRYFTSHDDAALPGGASATLGVIESISGTSQTLQADEANASIGNITFKVADKASAITSLLGTQLALGRSTRRQRVRFYVGYEGLAWADYSLVQTQLLTDLAWDGGAYTFRCMDVQREMRKTVFDRAKTNLALTVEENVTTIDVVSTAAFTMVAHGTSYSDSPSATVGYIKIQDEVIKYTGATSTQFTGCTRGALNTRPARHEADQNVAADKRTPVDEYVYLEMPALKLMYALLTGTLHNQGGATLPTKWHLGIPTTYVRLADFTSKPDLWDAADDTKGFVVRLEDLDKSDGKKFIEQQLARLCGVFMPIYASGELGLRRMANILAGAAYVRELNDTNIVEISELRHDFESLHNNLQVNWNWEPAFSEFTRINLLIDASSITQHGKADPLKLEFRGLHGSIHSSAILAQRFDALRDRYSGPPLRLSARVLPSCNTLEVGDVVRVRTSKIRDFVANGALDRSFEIQNVKIDWVTGNVNLDLFASSQAPGALAATADASVISNAWYTSQGTDLASVLTITGSNPGHVSANGTIAGGTDMNAAPSIFYYNGDLQIDVGVTVNVTGNAQLRIKGFFQNNGTVNAKGGGIAGAAAIGAVTGPASFTPGTQGFIGSIEAGGGLSLNKIKIGFSNGSMFIPNELSTQAPALAGVNAVVPPLNLKWTGSALQGIPTDMRGTSGSSGMPVYAGDTAFPNAAGGAGGASGAGLCLVCRGFAQGVAGKVDVSGGDGSLGSLYDAAPPSGPAARYYAGSGAGGAPGALAILLDGASLSATGLSETGFIALQGKTPQPPGRAGAVEQFAYPVNSSFFVGTGDGTSFPLASLSGARGGSRVQYVPNTSGAVADASPLGLVNPDSFSLFSRAVAKVGGGYQVQLEGTWRASDDPMVAGYDLQYRKSTATAWTSSSSVVGRTATSSVIATNLQPGIEYDARIRSAGSLRQTADTWVPIYRFYVAPTMVSGLELDPTNRISYDTFGGNDATVVWRADSQQGSYDIGSEPSGAGSGALDTYQKDYLVRVYNANGTQRREEVLTAVKEPRYTYTLEKNTQDGNGTPARAFTIRIFRRDNGNQVSPVAATLDVSNPQCGQPGSLALRAGFNTLVLDWTPPTGEIDCAGILVNISTSNGFTPSGLVPSSGNCRYAGADRQVIIDNLAPGTTYYVKAACFDTYGKASLNYSTQLSATTVQIQTADLADAAATIQKIRARRIEVAGDTWTDNSPGAGSVAWSAMSIAYDGTVSAVSAGNAANKWIYWTAGSATLSSSASFPALADNQFLVAVNNAGVHDMVWNASGIATKIIATAMIEDLAVGNAQINDLNAVKITAGDIAAARMQTNLLTAAQAVITQLSAVTANMGTITAGSITLNTSGFIRGGQSAFNDGSAGFFLGYSGGNYVLSLDNGSGQKLVADGTSLSYSGKLSAQNIVLTGSTPITILSDTSDGSDSKVVGIAGGGALGTTRGGQAQFFGNEANSTGEAGGVKIVGGDGQGSGTDLGQGWIQLLTSIGGGAAKGLQVDRGQSVLVGAGSAVASRTNEFFFIPTSAGAPSGTPDTIPTGLAGARKAAVYDTTNNKLYVYNGAWKASGAFT